MRRKSDLEKSESTRYDDCIDCRLDVWPAETVYFDRSGEHEEGPICRQCYEEAES